LALLTTTAALRVEAHDLPAIEIARLNGMVAEALHSGWSGTLVLMASGIALGALHGLEPGHAKTMMSAFIIAIRGTVGQAVLLGASATVSHTAVVWLLAIPLPAWGVAVNLSANAPYFQIASAVAVLSLAGSTLLRMVRNELVDSMAGPAESPRRR
jgi:nickel/cobalt exporter